MIGATERIIIYATRDIAAGEEMTYGMARLASERARAVVWYGCSFLIGVQTTCSTTATRARNSRACAAP
jgi:SET domain-containing protein